jgi:hypothetical protein
VPHRRIVLDDEDDGMGVTGHVEVIGQSAKKRKPATQTPSRWLQVGPKRSGTSMPV